MLPLRTWTTNFCVSKAGYSERISNSFRANKGPCPKKGTDKTTNKNWTNECTRRTNKRSCKSTPTGKPVSQLERQVEHQQELYSTLK